MANLDSTTLKELVDFFTPLLLDENNRRALLQLAVGSSPVYHQIQLSGPANTFTVQLISTLWQFGEITPGQPALVALLAASRTQVGVNQQSTIDNFIAKVNWLSGNADRTPLSRATSTAANLWPTPSEFTPYYSKSWAVVIGINTYADRRHTRLANAGNDARAMGEMLRQRGFENVHTLYDGQATRSAIMAWLRNELPTRTAPNDRVVFFFAGHGVTQPGPNDRKRGYLIPYDVSNFADYIDMEELRQSCSVIRAKHILVLLDCCFSGVAAVTVRSTLSETAPLMDDVYLARITQRRAWQVLTASDGDELAADSSTQPGHSAFTSALLAGLAGAADHDHDGLITATDLASYVRPRVVRESAAIGWKSQMPFFNYLLGSDLGDFVFTSPTRKQG